MSEITLPQIGITHGDLNGIGYEVIMKALNDPKILDMCAPAVYGAAKAASHYKNLFELQDFSMQVTRKAEQLNPKKYNFVNIFEQELTPTPGKSTPEAGRLAELALTTACKDLKSKFIDAIITAPVNKENMPASAKFNNHSEFIARQFSAQNALMMVLSDSLRMAFIASHDASKALNPELIIRKIKTLQQSLKMDFSCTNAKIAILALNAQPGKEEKEILAPVMKQAFGEKINVFGPLTAEQLFEKGEYAKFDAILALSPEHGLSLFQQVAGNQGVCFTAGMPIVHTAPLQDVMYDIAGKNEADCQPMRNALYCCIDIQRNRKEYLQYAKK